MKNHDYNNFLIFELAVESGRDFPASDLDRNQQKTLKIIR